MKGITEYDVLRRARVLLRGWCQGPFATDEEGKSVSWDKPEAACFCALGAVYRAAHDLPLKDAPHFVLSRACIRLGDAARRQGFTGAVDFNEAPGRTQEEVWQLFDEAIGGK